MALHLVHNNHLGLFLHFSFGGSEDCDEWELQHLKLDAHYDWELLLAVALVVVLYYNKLLLKLV